MVVSRLARLTRSVWLAAGVAAALHLAFIGAPLGTDEGGFALVARFWSHDGGYLYGPMWVDRPPGLFVVFDLALRLGPHMVAALCGATMVLASAAGARAVAGPRAAYWSAWAAAALSSSAFLSAQQLNGELIAATLVSIAMALLLVTIRRDAAFLAGLAAASAVMVKQNFVDGIAFGAVLLGHRILRRTEPRIDRHRAIAFLAGCASIGAAALGWSAAHGGPRELAYAMYGFRLDANRVLARTLEDGPDLGRGLAFAAASGLLGLAIALVWRQLRDRPVATSAGMAIAAAVMVETVGIVLGGSWWPHYFIALAPTISLGAGLVIARGSRLVRVLVVFAAASAVIATPVYAVQVQVSTSPDRAVAEFLNRNARSGESGLVAFTHVNVLEMAGLAPAYPFDWSLPVRVRDPRLDLMVTTLQGPTAPTWVVRWEPANAWELDPQDRIQAALKAKYHQVATICGHPVWRLASASGPISGPTQGC